MVFAALVVYLCLFCGPQSIHGILVSPDSALRNATITTTEETLNKTSREDILSLADRNRRLIPYMTFYIPNDYPINQHYNFAPNTHQVQYQPQQKQVIALYQAQHEQPNKNQQQQLQQQPPSIQNKPQKNHGRYPQRPQYEAIVYGMRHSTSSTGAKVNNSQYHLERAPVPVSFKDSNIGKPQPMHSTTKINLTPFTPENKLPGHFTPIIYGDQENYERKPQPNDNIKQHQDDLHDPPIRHQSTPIYTTPAPVVPILVSPSPRPIFPITNDDQQNQHLGLIHPLQHTPELTTHELTPQEKYVKYLQEQIQLKHKQNQQHHKPQLHIPDHDLQEIQFHQRPQQIFIVSSSQQPPPDNHIYYEKPEEPPINHQILYQPAGDEIDHGALNHSPTPHPVIYKNSPSSVPQAQYNNNNYPKYVEYVVPKSQISHNNEEMMKQIPYITTPAPVIVTPAMTTYKNRPVQHLKPITQIRPVYTPPKQFESQKMNVNLYKPTSSPQSVRQHLTETTQVPPPILTTYHPKLGASKHQYVSSHFSTPKPIRIPPSPKYSYKPIIVTEIVPKVKPLPIQQKTSELPHISSNSLAEILRKLQESNHLPQTLTPDNIDNSIQTLIKILNNLKQSQTIVESPPQHHEPNYDEYDDTSVDVDQSHPGPNSGRPGIDYPALAEIPHTRFNCKEQRYKGFFGDPETNCQVWHYCDLNGGQASFLCPNGTIFSQVALTCDWWFNVKCSSTAQLYVLNERLYKYILPFTPKFPEDYSGPLVDKYLALKFQEMEEKMRREKMKGKDESSSEKDDEEGEGHSTTEGDNSPEKESTGEDRSGIDSTSSSYASITSTDSSLHSMPIVVTSTEPSYSAMSSFKTSVESEKVEVIEIKSDGNSGLIPPRIFNSGLKKK